MSQLFYMTALNIKASAFPRNVLLFSWLFIFSISSTFASPWVKTTFDKRGIPTQIYLWDKVQDAGSGYYTDNNQDIIFAFVSTSDSDPARGKCPTAPVRYDSSVQGYGDITVRFYDKNDLNEYIDLNAKATHISLSGYAMPWAVVMAPHTDKKQTNKVEVFINKVELSQLPVGTWQSHIRLSELKCAWTNPLSNCKRVNIWEVYAYIIVTDTATQTIFFPSSPNSSPVVNLNLNAAGSAAMSTASGHNSSDMCLYDGSNSTSNRISLLFQDEGASAPGRPDGQFSVYRDGADKSSQGNRIDYAVSVINPTTGSPQAVQNGSEIIWTNTNARNILRKVVLPGVPGTSLCVPAPLTLTTPRFKL
ncbi:CfaE/CblD family pilus tip adhesin, partial [Pantoea ananatis]|uniref:CfaE/CblD family pilus tip adhesin n=1 Tax=Pantoea ananas TaxID=553 RepID=UPI001981F106